MWNTFRCEVRGTEYDEKPTIIRFSYKKLDGSPGVELIYLCSGCNSLLPRTNPVRRAKLVELFKSLYPNRELLPE
jgi:hypothetical protein